MFDKSDESDKKWSIILSQYIKLQFTSRLGSWIVIVNLDLNTRLGLKFRDVDFTGNLSEHRSIGLALQAVIEGVKICSSDDKVQMMSLAKKSTFN